MLAEVKNLRTQVARLAIVGLGDLFANLRRSMDSVSVARGSRLSSADPVDIKAIGSQLV